MLRDVFASSQASACFVLAVTLFSASVFASSSLGYAQTFVRDWGVEAISETLGFSFHSM
jgi:hypothetical protein